MKYLLCILLALTLPLSAAATTITFHNQAVVEGRDIFLGELADIQGADKPQLAQHRIAPAPPLGEQRVLPVTEVIRSLRRLPGSADFHYTGSATVTVTRKAIHVTVEQLKDMVATFLQDHLDQLPQAEIRLTHVRAPQDVLVPPGHLTWEVIPSRPEILGSSSFGIILKVNGKVVKNCTLHGHLEALGEVAVAAVTLQRGTVIEPAQIRMVRMDLTRLKDPFLDPARIKGLEVRRTIGSGRVIEKSMVQPPPVIRQGQLVKIFAVRGNLRLSTVGIAKADGRPGQVIRVANMGSRKLLYCRVDGPGIVSVEF